MISKLHWPLMCLSLCVVPILNSALAIPVVKIHSQICGSKQVQSVGSGVVIRDAAKIYVLTSDHVALANKAFCATANTERGQTLHLNLKASDFASGLAVYEVVDGNQAVEAMDANSKIQNLQSSDTFAITAGFPSKSNSPLIDRGATILSLSTRSPIADISKILEIKSLHGEFGMSGGGLFTKDGNFLGLLSHQRMQVNSGESSSVGTTGPIVLAIPAEFALKWFHEVLIGKLPTLVRDTNLQLRPEINVLDSALAPGFSLKSRPGQNHIHKQMRGGGDGAGIGGDPLQDSNVGIELNVQDLARLSSTAESTDLRWLRPLIPALIKRKSLSIEQVLILDPKNGSITLQYPRSLSEFLQLAGGENAVLLFKTEILPESSADLALSSVLEQVKKSDAPVLVEFARNLQALLIVHQDYPEMKIPPKVAFNMANSPALNELAALDFDAAVMIKTKLLNFGVSRTGL